MLPKLQLFKIAYCFNGLLVLLG